MFPTVRLSALNSVSGAIVCALMPSLQSKRPTENGPGHAPVKTLLVILKKQLLTKPLGHARELTVAWMPQRAAWP